MSFFHMSRIPGPQNVLGADFDCSSDSSQQDFPAKFAIAGDFDGDGRVEIAIAPDAPKTLGNDFWVMKFDPAAGTWHHMSRIPGPQNVLGADFDCSSGSSQQDIPAKFAVAGDFDGDGRAEIAIALEVSNPLFVGNDFWVMKFDPPSGTWNHMSPLPGLPTSADFRCFDGNPAATFAVAGDFDGDGRAEIAIANDSASETQRNDFWVMKFGRTGGTWHHMSPLPGHPFMADLDCSLGSSPQNIAATFAVAGDFDGDGRAEIAINLDPQGLVELSNDFWVMKFDPAGGTWHPMSPLSGFSTGIDFRCFDGGPPAKFAVASDFDGDGRAEIAIALDAPKSGGNDFWVMKFNPPGGTWHHMSPLSGYPNGADLDCSSGSSQQDFPAKFAVASDFDGDGRAEIAIAPDAPKTLGNDFWVMKFGPVSGTWNHMSRIPGPENKIGADFDCSSGSSQQDFPAKFAVAGDFDGNGRAEIAIAPDAPKTLGNDFWAMAFSGEVPNL